MCTADDTTVFCNSLNAGNDSADHGIFSCCKFMFLKVQFPTVCRDNTVIMVWLCLGTKTSPETAKDSGILHNIK